MHQLQEYACWLDTPAVELERNLLDANPWPFKHPTITIQLCAMLQGLLPLLPEIGCWRDEIGWRSCISDDYALALLLPAVGRSSSAMQRCIAAILPPSGVFSYFADCPSDRTTVTCQCGLPRGAVIRRHSLYALQIRRGLPPGLASTRNAVVERRLQLQVRTQRVVQKSFGSRSARRLLTTQQSNLYSLAVIMADVGRGRVSNSKRWCRADPDTHH
jgi:hypothetical protein